LKGINENQSGKAAQKKLSLQPKSGMIAGYSVRSIELTSEISTNYCS
jgi:hypothetical protein